MALCSTIPLLSVIEYATKGIRLTKHKLLTFKATEHEDNMDALILAKLEPERALWLSFWLYFESSGPSGKQLKVF